MASSYHIGVIDNKTTLHNRGVNRSHKIITFSHLNST